MTCPLGLIDTKSYQVESSVITDLFSRQLVDAIEIHTQYQHDGHFNELFDKIGDSGNYALIQRNSSLSNIVTYLLTVLLSIDQCKSISSLLP